MARGRTERPATEGLLPEAPVAVGGYQTTDGNEALKYIIAGAKLVGVTKLHPTNPYKPGKRYLFLESKAVLETLVANAEETT